MKVKSGYKLAEVGLIPEDWDEQTIFELSSQILDLRGRTPKKLGMEWGGGDIPALSAGNVKMGFIDFSEDCYLASEALYKRWMTRGNVKKDDIIFTTEAPLGNVALIPDNRKYILSQRTVLLQIDPERASSQFLFQFMLSEPFQKVLHDYSSGSTAKGIQRKKLEQLCLVRPPLPEQRNIAKALSDVDALLSVLDRIIAKKRDLKQAAMQQLLTGQIRLPGFHDEWKVKTFGELFNFSGGYSASRDQLSSEGHCYLHYGDVHGAMKTFVDVRTDYQNIPKLDIPLKRVASKSLLEDGDVVFVDASEDDEGTSRHIVVVNKDKEPFISGLHTIVAKSKTDELAHEYRRYCFQTAAIRQQFHFYAVGTKVSGISKSNIPKLTLPVPSVPEQTAIAEVLSDMDAELVALEQRREKTRELKQGMMQELLTGTTRLHEKRPPNDGGLSKGLKQQVPSTLQQEGPDPWSNRRR